MEYTLENHYKVKGKDLKDTIDKAKQKFPQLDKFKLQDKRILANDILHSYEKDTNVGDSVVVEYLRTIKFLVQGVPNRKSQKNKGRA